VVCSIPRIVLPLLLLVLCCCYSSPRSSRYICKHRWPLRLRPALLPLLLPPTTSRRAYPLDASPCRAHPLPGATIPSSVPTHAPSHAAPTPRRSSRPRRQRVKEREERGHTGCCVCAPRRPSRPRDRGGRQRIDTGDAPWTGLDVPTYVTISKRVEYCLVSWVCAAICHPPPYRVGARLHSRLLSCRTAGRSKLFYAVAVICHLIALSALRLQQLQLALGLRRRTAAAALRQLHSTSTSTCLWHIEHHCRCTYDRG
jgi:hypothetical protein